MMCNQETVETFTRFAARALLDRLEKITREIEGVRRAEDIEYVHRIRVASRRMRAALRHLQTCFDKAHIKGWRKEVRRITGRLGEARDLDVQLEAVRAYRGTLPPEACLAGVERLALRLHQQRAKAQPRIERALDRFIGSGVIEHMHEHLQPLAERNKAAGERDCTGRDLARRAVVEQLHELEAHDPYLPEPDNGAELHAMRIACKRLRYTLELFAPIYEGELKSYIKEVKSAQSLLGDLHDCDVWELFLQQFLIDERRRTEHFQGAATGFEEIEAGIHDFMAERRQRREALRLEFLALWEAQQANRTWSDLRRYIELQDPPRASNTAPAAHASEQPAGGLS